MGIMIAVAVAILLSVAALAAGCRKVPQTTEQPPPRVVQVPSPDHEAFRQRLEKLAEGEPPKELSWGAMCYDMATPPDRFDYVCPVCHTKTVLANEPRLARTPWELEACRRLVKEVKGLDVSLVETGFCQICFPDAKQRSLDLAIRHPDGSSHRVQGVTSEDLKLIAEFLAGKDKHVGAQDRETPMKDHISRLRELLVLPEDTK